MRDRTKETAETIDETRLDMAGVTAMMEWVGVLAERNGEGAIDEIKEIVKKQGERLTAMRRKLNKPWFDNTFSPLGFEIGS